MQEYGTQAFALLCRSRRRTKFYQGGRKTVYCSTTFKQTNTKSGTGTGYYITNGYAVPITWTKTSRSAQTIYKYIDGTEITVNDGNTFIQIQPINQVTSIG